MSQPIDISTDPESELETIKLATAKAQLKKLNLEIENLQVGRSRGERLTRFIPIITALISIAGFMWGVLLYRNQQESDRKTREADQISRDLSRYRTSYDELLQFSSNQNMTVARVLALRQDLDGLIDSLYPVDKNQDENRRQKDRLKSSIYDLISKDFDFTQTRQVQFDIAALQNWVDYKKGLEGNLNFWITDKYLKALGDLRYKNPGVLESIKLNEGEEYPDPENAIGEPYRSVIEGFVCHFNLLSDKEQTIMKTKFGNVTYNQTLAADLAAFKCPAGVLLQENIPNSAFQPNR
jgi:hypothetical protein